MPAPCLSMNPQLLPSKELTRPESVRVELAPTSKSVSQLRPKLAEMVELVAPPATTLAPARPSKANWPLLLPETPLAATVPPFRVRVLVRRWELRPALVLPAKRVAPALTVTLALANSDAETARPVGPEAAPLRLRVPSLSTTVPVRALLAERPNVPEPVLVKPLVPAKEDAMRLLALVATVRAGAVPPKVMVPPERVVAASKVMALAKTVPLTVGVAAVVLKSEVFVKPLLISHGVPLTPDQLRALMSHVPLVAPDQVP